MHYFYYGHGYGLWHDLFAFVLFVGAAILIALIIQKMSSPSNEHTTPTAHRALDILKERFAKGEIDKAEYEERKEILSK